MSTEFWLGVVISAILFLAGSLISVFAEDIRQRFKAWQASGRLRGTALRIDLLRRKIGEIEFYRNNPGALTAYLWQGFYLLLQFIAVVIFCIWVTEWTDIPLLRIFGKVVGLSFGFIAWIFILMIAKKTEVLSRPDIQGPKLAEELAELERSNG